MRGRRDDWVGSQQLGSAAVSDMSSIPTLPSRRFLKASPTAGSVTTCKRRGTQ